MDVEDEFEAGSGSEDLSDVDEDNSISSEVAGQLEKIVLIDFMCHKHFKIKFGKNINFITGQNGSGKSVIVL